MPGPPRRGDDGVPSEKTLAGAQVGRVVRTDKNRTTRPVNPTFLWLRRLAAGTTAVGGLVQETHQGTESPPAVSPQRRLDACEGYEEHAQCHAGHGDFSTSLLLEAEEEDSLTGFPRHVLVRAREEGSLTVNQHKVVSTDSRHGVR